MRPFDYGDYMSPDKNVLIARLKEDEYISCKVMFDSIDITSQSGMHLFISTSMLNLTMVLDNLQVNDIPISDYLERF